MLTCKETYIIDSLDGRSGFFGCKVTNDVEILVVEVIRQFNNTLCVEQIHGAISSFEKVFQLKVGGRAVSRDL